MNVHLESTSTTDLAALTLADGSAIISFLSVLIADISLMQVLWSRVSLFNMNTDQRHVTKTCRHVQCSVNILRQPVASNMGSY